jgi:hypothetical protein
VYLIKRSSAVYFCWVTVSFFIRNIEVNILGIKTQPTALWLIPNPVINGLHFSNLSQTLLLPTFKSHLIREERILNNL